MISPVVAKLRYCAVAHTRGRSHTRSMAATAAPRPQPPNRKLPPVMIPSVTGRYQRDGLWVGSRPRNSAASMAAQAIGAPLRPTTDPGRITSLG